MLVAASPLSKPATNAALVLCVVLFARDWWAGRRRPRGTPLDPAILAWLVVNLIAALTSIDRLRSFSDLRSIGHWSALYFVAWGASQVGWARVFQNVWMASGGLSVAQALLQATVGFDLLGRTGKLPTGFFGGHLEFGHYMVLLLALALARSSAATASRERWICFCAALAYGAGLVVSGGRGPWLALAAVIVSGSIVGRGAFAIGVLALVCVIQAGFFAARGQGLGTFYRSYVAFELAPDGAVPAARVASNLWRLSMWREGLRHFEARPATGTGVESTGKLSPGFRTPFADLAVAHLHSNYFEILMTRGFFGLTAFFWWMILSARYLRGLLGEASPSVARASVFVGLASIVTHLVHGLTHFTIGSSWIQIGSLVALGLGLGEGLRRGSREISAVELSFDRSHLVWMVLTIAAAFVATPWIDAHAVLASMITIAAVLGSVAGWAMGRRSSLDAALAAAFGFVSVATMLLLPGAEERVRVVLAGGVSFGIGLAGLRLATLGRVRAVESPSRS